MADTKFVVAICLDGSKHSDYALKCKYTIFNLFHYVNINCMNEFFSLSNNNEYGSYLVRDIDKTRCRSRGIPSKHFHYIIHVQCVL